MKRARLVAAVVLTLCGGAGCYSMHTASSPTLSGCALASEDGVIVEHVFVENSGWFLFERFPLVCGNVDADAWLPWSFFRNETDLTRIEARLLQRARQQGAAVVQENVINSGRTLMSIPGTNIALSVPYLICRRETQISALLVKRPRRTAP